MSWFARSIADSLNFDQGVPDEDLTDFEQDSPTSQSRGVKNDLSELSRTLTRQFRGFASFLAPPPQKSDQDASGSEVDQALGIRGDFSEIGGRFRSGISRFSNNINVSEITKMASSFLQLESDDESEGKDPGKGPIGVTEEVVAFARDIAIHPETWLDFPLLENDGDFDEFDMSDEQQEHALAVEQHAPRLAALRMELCPRHMSDDHFWKIYFVLVHTRLDKEDALLLSTPQVMEARALLANELKNRNADLSESFTEKSLEQTPAGGGGGDHDQEESSLPGKWPDQDASQPDIEPSDDGEGKGSQNHLSSRIVVEDEVDDDWLEEETINGIGGSKSIPVGEEDVSFSDLEEEEEEDGDTVRYRKSSSSSDKDTRDWVELGKTDDTKKRGKAQQGAKASSSDWLDVDEMIVS